MFEPQSKNVSIAGAAGLKRGLPRGRRPAKFIRCRSFSARIYWNGRRMTAKANSVKQEIFRLQTHYEIQGFIERAKDEGLAEDDAIEALERAIEELKDFRERARDAIIHGRLF